MSKRAALVFSVGVAVIAGACDADDATVDAEQAAMRLLQGNGFTFNGFTFNGFTFNGFTFNGFTFNSPDGSGDYVKLEMLDPPGDVAAEAAWLVGSELTVALTNGQVLSGAGLVDAVIHFEVLEQKKNNNKKGKRVRIDGVAPLSPGSDILVYSLSLREETGPWKPLCTDAQGDPTGSIFLGEVWSGQDCSRIEPRPDGAATFACVGGALAKCAMWGYRPWASEDGVSLRDYHQACTRLVRADYCGTGESHTHEGVGIHVLDKLGIQAVDPNVNYVVEAEWGPNGATCLNPANTRLPNQTIGCQIPACDDQFESGIIQSGKVVASP